MDTDPTRIIPIPSYDGYLERRKEYKIPWGIAITTIVVCVFSLIVIVASYSTSGKPDNTSSFPGITKTATATIETTATERRTATTRIVKTRSASVRIKTRVDTRMMIRTEILTRVQSRTLPAKTTFIHYFANCTDAKAAGYMNIRKGSPEYRSALDADNDGIACEA